MTTELGGRPTDFTPDVKERLLVAIRKGAPYDMACAYAGISYSCLNKWRKKAETGQDPDFVQFFHDLNQIKAQTALVWLDKIDKAMNDGVWQAAAWKLERRYYRHFSNHAPIVEMEERIRKMEESLSRKDDGNGEEA
jgi:hypothetical protein